MTCETCKWSRNWCCGKKKAKGFIMCLNPKHLPPPLERLKTEMCRQWEKK